MLVAHLTPGHTKGCTTWTMKVQRGGKTYNVVIIGSPNVNPGYKLVNNPRIRRSPKTTSGCSSVLKSLPCDLFLGAHGSYFDMEAKVRAHEGSGRNPLIDPEGCKTFVAQKEQEFRAELAKQKAVRAELGDTSHTTEREPFSGTSNSLFSDRQRSRRVNQP